MEGNEGTLRLLPDGQLRSFKVEVLPEGTLLFVERTQPERPDMPQTLLLNTTTRTFVHVKQLTYYGGALTNIGYMSVGTCR